MDDEPCLGFNPLDEFGISEADLRETLLTEFLVRDCIALPKSSDAFDGCGIYALYYYGEYPHYEPISNTRGDPIAPIYVGTATPTPTDSHIGYLTPTDAPRLAQRLAAHRRSIHHVDNLHVHEFRCRFLPLGTVWIQFAEHILRSTFTPWWNAHIEGFDIPPEEETVTGSTMSLWDALHPGRPLVADHDLAAPSVEESLWDEYVQPSIEAARREREFKDIATLRRLPTLQNHAPLREEASLYDFTNPEG